MKKIKLLLLAILLCTLGTMALAHDLGTETIKYKSCKHLNVLIVAT